MVGSQRGAVGGQAGEIDRHVGQSETKPRVWGSVLQATRGPKGKF